MTQGLTKRQEEILATLRTLTSCVRRVRGKHVFVVAGKPTVTIATKTFKAIEPCLKSIPIMPLGLYLPREAVSYRAPCWVASSFRQVAARRRRKKDRVTGSSRERKAARAKARSVTREAKKKSRFRLSIRAKADEVNSRFPTLEAKAVVTKDGKVVITVNVDALLARLA